MTEEDYRFEDKLIVITISLMLFVSISGLCWIGYGIYLLL